MTFRSVLLTCVALACGSQALAEELWVLPSMKQPNGRVGTWGVNKLKQSRFAFAVPTDFVSLQRASIVFVGRADGTFRYDAAYALAEPGERHDTESVVLEGLEWVSTRGVMGEIDVTTLLEGSSVESEKLLSVSIEILEKGVIGVIGLRFSYVDGSETGSPDVWPAIIANASAIADNAVGIEANSSLAYSLHDNIARAQAWVDHLTERLLELETQIESMQSRCFGSGARYCALGDGTVKDMVTGLVWLQSPYCALVVPSDFERAQQNVARLGDGECGLSDGSAPGDWRLPDVSEWAATIERARDLGCTNPRLTNVLGVDCLSVGPSAFPWVPTYVAYWTGTASGGATAQAMDLAGGVFETEDSDRALRVWPVRDSMSRSPSLSHISR